jgi:hypothetical protein
MVCIDDRTDDFDLFLCKKTSSMRIIFLILILLHGLIHLLGFAKAFNLAGVSQLNQNIPKTTGILWLLTAILMLATALLFFLKQEWWCMSAAVAILLSQYLIFSSWQDAGFGTVANIILLFAIITGYGIRHFNNQYKNEVNAGLKRTSVLADSLLTETDMQSLPEPVKKYLHYTGAVGKPKVKNFKVEFAGQIRKNEQSEWMPFSSEQYNFLDASTRLFFMNATMKPYYWTFLKIA